jgi:hypothetical protein
MPRIQIFLATFLLVLGEHFELLHDVLRDEKGTFFSNNNPLTGFAWATSVLCNTQVNVSARANSSYTCTCQTSLTFMKLSD